MDHKTGMRVYGIAGCGFSGSTLLSFLLGSHSGIFSTGEAYKTFQVYRRLLENREFSYYCSMHHVECDFWTPEFLAECNDGDLDVLYDRIARFDPENKVVVHSFKNPGVYLEMLHRYSPVHGLIVLFKRPVAYYSSARVHLGIAVSEACKEYEQRYSRALNLCSEHRIPMFPLFYDDLATRTDDCLKSLCTWMGLEYEPGMVEPWTVSDQTHMVSGNTGVFMHMWKEPVRNWVLQSDTWKETYSPDHEQWLEQNYRKIALDEKWRSLPADEIARVNAHETSRHIFEQLLQMNTLRADCRQAAP
jgi:Sulfotransferase family